MSCVDKLLRITLKQISRWSKLVREHLFVFLNHPILFVIGQDIACQSQRRCNTQLLKKYARSNLSHLTHLKYIDSTLTVLGNIIVAKWIYYYVVSRQQAYQKLPYSTAQKSAEEYFFKNISVLTPFPIFLFYQSYMVGTS